MITNSVKTKFAGLLRGLLRHFDDDEMPRPQKPRPLPATAPAPVVAEPQAQSAPAPAASATPASVKTVAANSNEMELPLHPILSALPMDLRAKVMQAPPAGTTLVVPIENVLSQLATGSVKITFGELRQAAPGVFVHTGGENDLRPVTLPLNEILSRLNPMILSRRATQKQTEVADEITGPFGARAQGITFTATPIKPAPATPPLSRLTMPVEAASLQPPPVAPPPPFSPRSITPAALSAPAYNGNGNRNSNGNSGNGSRNGNTPGPDIAAPIVPSIKPVFSAAPIPFNMPAAPAASGTESTQLTISAPLAALSENWPDALQMEITQQNLSNAQVALPVHLIEPMLKRGRVIFSWRHVRSWIKPAPPSVSVHDGVELELPLKILAPLFVAAQKAAAKPQQKLSVTEEIPNLFFGFPQTQPETIIPATPPPRATKPADSKIPDTNFYVWGENGEAPQIDESEYKRPQMPATDFTHRHATPKYVVSRAMILPGVAGALVALPDGLMVASQISAEFNADTLAAFLPQIFERVNQSTKELRMGALNNVSFTVGNIPWKIFRVNAVYFAAFGRAGQPLPTMQLAALAAELDRKKQQ
jgi:predicted regulator of Ras-like GTPase activity (Roadblock/LC7/MglB family)